MHLRRRHGIRKLRGHRAPWVGCVTCLVATTAQVGAEDTPLATVLVASDLDRPLYVTHAPGDFGRLFIVEQSGRIKILNNGQVLGTPFLNLDPVSQLSSEGGLLGFTFHPDYGVNGFMYVNYCDNSGATVVARYKVSNDPDVADPDSGNVILTIDQPTNRHNGAWLAFGPDGYLYVAMGDGGPWFDPNNRAQTTTDELLGKLLRIDVNGDDWPDDPERNYSIPQSNPFVGLDGDDEIWAYGLRNPWRCAFDSETGDLYIADVGQGDFEEINFQSALSTGGENYGWRCMEAFQCTELGGCTCGSSELTLPIHAYEHTDSPPRCSITGGEVYRGCAIPELAGTYFFADFCTDEIWSFRYNGSVTEFTERSAELDPGAPLRIGSISSFGRDAFGELYICDLGGEVYKIVSDTLSVIATDSPDRTIDALQLHDPNGAPYNRFLGFIPGNAGQQTAIQITLDDIGPFPALDGSTRWLGPPKQCAECDIATPFIVADLRCEPHYTDWGSLGTVYAHGAEVVPDSTYTIRMIPQGCDVSLRSSSSAGLAVATGKWGDVTEPFAGGPATQPDFTDISATVECFTCAPGSRIVECQLQPNVPRPCDRPVDFSDIAAAISAFTGQPYPFEGPSACP